MARKLDPEREARLTGGLNTAPEAPIPERDLSAGPRAPAPPPGDTVRGVSNPQNAADALAQIQQQLAAIINNIPAYVYVLDRDGRYLLANRAYRELVGAVGDELYSQSIFDRFPAEIAAELHTHNLDVVRHRHMLEFDEHAVFEGEDRIYRSVKTPLLDMHGAVSGVVGISTDVTQVRKQEDRLRESSARLQLALDVGEIGTMTLELTTELAELDARARQIFGLDQHLVTRSDWLSLVHPADRERVDAETKAARDPAGSGFVESEYRILRPDGQLRWVHRRSAVMFTGEGKSRHAFRVIVIIQDVTERKRFETAQQEFLAMASHELRSPLAALKGNAQLLQRRGQYEERIAQTIVEQSDHLERLVHDLMDVTIATTGHFRLRRSVVDLVQLVRDQLREQQQTTKRHHLQLRASPDTLEGTWDADRLRQVLRNLFSNAIKYSPDGGTISADVEIDGEQVIVRIEDEGIGIPAEEQAKIFERFYRLDPDSGRAEGLGLGLDVTRALVEAHGGQIWVSSESDKGSCFQFTLPRDAADDAPASTEPSGPVHATVSGRNNFRVLVVDDDPVLQRLVKDALEDEGYEVGLADDGRQALNSLSRRPYHLVLLDLMMPNLDGPGFMAELHRRGLRDAVRVMVVSASHEARSRGDAIGAEDVLEKPFELGQLLSKVDSLLAHLTPRVDDRHPR